MSEKFYNTLADYVTALKNPGVELICHTHGAGTVIGSVTCSPTAKLHGTVMPFGNYLQANPEDDTLPMDDQEEDFAEILTVSSTNGVIPAGAVIKTGTAFYVPQEEILRQMFASMANEWGPIHGHMSSDEPGIAKMAPKPITLSAPTIINGVQCDAAALAAFLESQKPKAEPNNTPKGIMFVADMDHRLGCWK